MSEGSETATSKTDACVAQWRHNSCMPVHRRCSQPPAVAASQAASWIVRSKRLPSEWGPLVTKAMLRTLQRAGQGCISEQVVSQIFALASQDGLSSSALAVLALASGRPSLTDAPQWRSPFPSVQSTQQCCILDDTRLKCSPGLHAGQTQKRRACSRLDVSIAQKVDAMLTQHLI